MNAQSSGNLVTAAVQKATVVEKLEKILDLVGIKADGTRFKESFENVNISDGGYEVISSTVSAFYRAI